MANTIRIKRSTTAAAPSSLTAGELAYSQNSQKLWIGRPNDGGAVLAIGGELYVNMLDHTAGTLTASSAIVVDGNSKVNQLKTTNLTIGANAITSGSGDVDIVAAANLDIDASTIDLSTQATEVSIIDNSGTALVFKEANNSYLTLSTVNGSERVTITPATTITGALTVGGTITGTLATAAQANITSLGTLTALTVDNLGINGNTITANSGAVNITPAAGSAIVLDGTVNVDAGVVTGATSVTSTAFVGTLSTAAQPNITSLGTIASLVATTADINNGTVEAVIGGATPKAGTFTTVTANTSITGTLATAAQPNITSLGTIASLVATTADINAGTVDAVVGGTTPAAGTFTIAKANTSLQTPLIEFTDGDDAIVIVDGGGVTIASLTSPSVDINGGAIDGTIIGANSAAAITGAAITGTIVKGTTSLQTPLIEFTDGDDAITIADGGGVTIGNLTATTADINAGTVDATIGGSTPASGTFTTLTANTSITGTLATAAQTNVTSLGTLTTLTVDDLTVNANDVTASGSNAIDLIPGTNATVLVPAGYKDRSGFGDNSLASKEYVDAIKTGLDVKDSVRVATTANGTLSSAFANSQAVDGVTLATNDRILLKNQTTGSQNGIYTVNASGAPTRATDYDASSEVTGGAFVFVEEGTTNADSGWILTNNGAVTVGTTALTYAQFSSAGLIGAGDGLSKSGSTMNINDDNITLEIASDTLRIKAVTATAVGDLLYGKASNAGYNVLAKPAEDSSFLTMGTAGTAAWTTTIDGGTFS